MGSPRRAPTTGLDEAHVSPTIDVVARVVPAPYPVAVRDAEPRRPVTETALVWLHGGGWVTGGLDAGESVCVAWELATRGRRVRTVDYRLAPFLGLASPRLAPSPHRYPAALDDVVAACVDLARDGTAIAVGGASAGAAVAAAAVLRLQALGVRPRAMVLAYGALHAVLPARSEHGALGALGLVTPEWASRWMYARFARNDAGRADAGGAFASGDALSTMPPTLVLDAHRDPLRASGAAFAHELGAAGATVERHVEAGTWHGYLSRPGTPAFDASIARITAWLDRADASGSP